MKTFKYWIILYLLFFSTIGYCVTFEYQGELVLDLKKAIGFALARYPGITEKKFEARSQKNKISYEESFYWPKVSYRISYNVLDDDWEVKVPFPDYLKPIMLNAGINNSIIPEYLYPYVLSHRSFLLGLYFEMPIITYGKLHAKKDIAKNKWQIAKSDLTTAKKALIKNVSDTYYKIIYYKELIDETINFINKLKILKNHVVKNKTYETASLDAMQISTTITYFENNLNVYEENLKAAKEALLSFLNLQNTDPPIKLKIIDEKIPVTEKKFNVKSCVDIAVANSASLHTAKKSLNILKDTLYIEKRKYYPDIYLKGDVIYINNEKNYTYDYNSDTDVMVSVVAEAPLFDGFATNSKVKEYKNKIKAIKAKIDKIQADISAKIKVNLSEISKNLGNLKNQQEYIQQLIKCGKIAESLYMGSKISCERLLFNLKELYNARLTYITHKLTYILSLSNLYYNMGITP